MKTCHLHLKLLLPYPSTVIKVTSQTISLKGGHYGNLLLNVSAQSKGNSLQQPKYLLTVHYTHRHGQQKGLPLLNVLGQLIDDNPGVIWGLHLTSTVRHQVFGLPCTCTCLLVFNEGIGHHDTMTMDYPIHIG